MKIYAKQVPPEHQESPLFLGEEFWLDNVHVYGNRDYREHGSYSDTSRALDQLSQGIDDLRSGQGWYTGGSLEGLLQDYFPREKLYTRAERLRFLNIVATFWEYPAGSDKEHAAIREAMELRDGIEYAGGTIRGCCQGDWQKILYPAEYGREWLDAFETEYFNTGTEWIIHDGNADPGSPEEIDGFSCYCHGWSNEQIKKEIAEAYGTPDAEVVLYKFTGWKRTAQYKGV